MHHPLRVMIIDDEPEAVELLSIMLDRYAHADVVATSIDVNDAIRKYYQHTPDLVLLDIQMPGRNGFDFIEEIHHLEVKPGVIFVTAYENYAIQALRTSAFDYILKPVKSDELKESLDRFIRQAESRKQEDLSDLLTMLKPGVQEKIRLNTRTGYILINPKEIVYCMADGNYTSIQLFSGQQEMVAQNLGSIEKLLQPEQFFRISRSYLINLDYLIRVDRKSCVSSLVFNGNEKKIKTPVQKLRTLERYF